MTTAVKERTTAAQPEAPSRLSPFPKIADYAFLSNCHTGALVGLDGSVDWLCVPKFDAPSIFGSLLDREAGTFRFGPYGVDHPTTRIYVPGTNVVETTWKTPSGWIVVRDALTMGQHDSDDCVTPHTRPPMDWDASHTLVRTATCIEGAVEIEAVCEPAFDYGRTPATWQLDTGRHRAVGTGAGVTIELQSDIKLGVEGQRIRGRHVLHAGESVYCSLSWSDKHEAPGDVTQAIAAIDATVGYWRQWLAGARIPDHEFREPIQRSALTTKGLTYMPTGATVGRAHHVVARDAWWRPELGLSIHLAPRLDVHPAGAALADA
jgi:GH15 family glucan-1,4-alpha-glucosidase